jgi:hypothetical protein
MKPKKQGETFKAGKRIYTVDYFFNGDGNRYCNYETAVNERPNGTTAIVDIETGGVFNIEYVTKINKQ